jgi:hypothetical protein
MTVDVSLLCFAAGTRILAARGEVSVETLREGDLVVGLRSGKMAPVRWIGHRNVDLRAQPNPQAINPVRICADAFGPGRPRRDLILSPNHALYVDGQLIAVRHLLNGATIRQERWNSVVYYHVELDAHDVLFAEGIGAESFLDTGCRAAFSNGGEAVMLHPDFALQCSEAKACAPEYPHGEALAGVRQRLLDRVGALGHRLTEDADLRVLVGNKPVRSRPVPGGAAFYFPKGTGRVRIVSRSFVPGEMQAAHGDCRRLGVGVLGIRLDGRAIALDDSRLGSGWYAPEPGLRWTTGEAWLRTSGARTLMLTLLNGATYWLKDDQTTRLDCNKSA